MDDYKHVPLKMVGALKAMPEADFEALRKGAEHYRKLRNSSMDERNRLEHYAGPALDALPAVRAA